MAFLTWMGSMSVQAEDFPTGVVRLKSKLTEYYLSTAEKGSATTTVLDKNSLSQVWILLPSDNGYILRSANTGEFLQADYAKPASGQVTLYVRKSSNATASDVFYNISSDSGFGGKFLNTNTSHNLFSYSLDNGCNWYIEAVTEFTLDQIKERILGMSNFAGELSEGQYYRIISYYGRALRDTEEAGGDMSTQPVDATDIAQYWTLTKDGDNWQFENALTQRLIQRQTSQSTPYHTATKENVEQFTLKVSFQVKRAADDWDYKWTIAYPGDARGFHDSDSQGHNMVAWSTDADASVWQFEKVDVTQEAIDAAREKIYEYEKIVEQFNAIVKQKSALQKALDALFADKACTTLKDEIAALGDEDLAANESYATLTDDMKAMVLKVKNNTWQQYTDGDYTADYERFFRVADYKVYSHYQTMANGDNFTMSNSFGKLSGPTGIVANKGDVIYIYVDQSADSNCTLQLEAVSTSGVPGNNQTGTTTVLKKGLNLFQFAEQKMLYIFYQLNTTTGFYRKLSSHPDIKIHIEGGQLNGYWDATRGMTNADWKLLQKDLLKASPVLNLKTEHLVFCMNADLVKQYEPNEMEGLMRIWEQIPVNEERYMGVEDFEGRYRNVWNVFSINYNYMFASTYGTYYNESTLETIMNYENMRKSGAIWGPSHEIGHNHQASINVIGTTESSNNLFSNINTFEQGIITTRRQLPVDVFWELGKDTPWLGRNIWNTTSMFFQLYLYFHAMHHDDNFLPNLFRMMRKKPINKWSGPGNGGPTSYGKDDYLHLAKMICDVAEADLSEFFEAYGMFVPVDMYEVGDYSTYFVTTTQAEIDAAKKYMQKYPKKLGNIMFIDDHISPMKDADPNNKFEGVPASDGKKKNNLDQHNEVAEYANLPVGDVGDYEEFDGHEEYDVTGDYFTISGSTVSFKGSGYVGHKFYDLDGNLIWATNAKSSTLPAKLKKLGTDKYYVVAAQQNMTDVPCPYYSFGVTPKYNMDVYFGQEEGSKQWSADKNTKLADYLPENAVAVVTSKNAPENVTTAPNVVNQDGTAASIVINGDKPFYLPSDVAAESVAFTKTVDGYAALSLPFEVKNTDLAGLKTATYEEQQLQVVDAATVAAGAPVVVNGNVNLELSQVAVKAGSFQPLLASYVLAADGQSLEAVETASPFTYTFGEATAVSTIAADGQRAKRTTEIFDLTGRRVGHATHGIYIVNGKKVLVK